MEKRNYNKCPDCGGELINEDGKIKCVKCDFGQEERRKQVSREYSDWMQT